MKKKDIFGKDYLEVELDDILNATDLGSEHVVEDWPYGRQKRCIMKFSIESTKRGERLVKQSTFNGRVNKPKKTTYATRATIIDIHGKIGHVEFSKSMSHVSVRMQDGSFTESTFFDEDALTIAKHFFGS